MRSRRQLSERMFRLEQKPKFEPFDVVCIYYGHEHYQKGIITREPDVFYNKKPSYHFYVYNILVVGGNRMWIDEGNNERDIARASDLPEDIRPYNDGEFDTLIRKIENRKDNSK